MDPRYAGIRSRAHRALCGAPLRKVEEYGADESARGLTATGPSALVLVFCYAGVLSELRYDTYRCLLFTPHEVLRHRTSFKGWLRGGTIRRLRRGTVRFRLAAEAPGGAGPLAGPQCGRIWAAGRPPPSAGKARGFEAPPGPGVVLFNCGRGPHRTHECVFDPPRRAWRYPSGARKWAKGPYSGKLRNGHQRCPKVWRICGAPYGARPMNGPNRPIGR